MGHYLGWVGVSGGGWGIILGGWGRVGGVGVGALFDNAYLKDTMKAYFCYRHTLF